MLAPEFFPVWGGTGSYIVELVKNIPENVNIHVVTLKRKIKGATGRIENEMASVIKRPINVHYVSDSRETFLYNFSFQLACFRKIPSLHKKYNFDIIHSHLCHMPDVFLRLFNRNFANFPTVVTLHGTIQMLRDHALHARSLFGDLESGEESILKFYPLVRMLENHYVKSVTKFIAVSKATKELAQEYLKVESNRIEIIYNGVDTDIFQSQSNNESTAKYDNPTVMYIGRLISKKGLHVLLKAIPEVLRSVPKARFVFVGGGDISLYRKKMKAMGIPNKNFSFVGHVGYFQRPRILQEATVFVNPSFFENCSLSILEAMSSNKAVVACSVGGNPEIIKSGKNGLLFPPLNHRILAESIVALLKDEKLNRRLSIEARKTIEKSFSSKICAQKTLNLYYKILNQ